MLPNFKLHPWHGVPQGPGTPGVLTAYIEITPSDTVKYELDKNSGILKVDRPQLYSNVVPALYGFIPQTYCGDEVAAISKIKTGRTYMVGDGDPLDILVLTEHRIMHGDILVKAIPIGGFLMIDADEADDKIIAVLEKDSLYGDIHDLHDLPVSVIDRIRHYFLTYKRSPDGRQSVQLPETYDREEAYRVIRAASQDYLAKAW
jgi:inorganic pyrophosphatase